MTTAQTHALTMLSYDEPRSGDDIGVKPSTLFALEKRGFAKCINPHDTEASYSPQKSYKFVKFDHIVQYHTHRTPVKENK